MADPMDFTPPQAMLLSELAEYGPQVAGRNSKAAKALIKTGLARNGGPNRKGQLIIEISDEGRKAYERLKRTVA